MTLNFRPDHDFSFITRFAEAFSVPSAEDHLIVPAELGKGSIRKVDVSADLVVLLHHYTLNEDFILKRQAPIKKIDRITIIFYRSTLPQTVLSTETEPAFVGPRTGQSVVELSSNDLSSTVFFPAHQEIHFIVVGITASLLLHYLESEVANPLIQNVTGGTENSFLYYETLWPEIEHVLEHLRLINVDEPLSHFHFSINVEELLYQLFRKLLQRESQSQQSVRNEDVMKMQAIRQEIVTDLSQPPALARLAKNHGIGQTRMKSLFKQIFGASIYHYYQTARMEEAAFLLQHGHLAVAEVGRRLGFSNLSHFSRLFKKHFHQTPKKYSSA